MAFERMKKKPTYQYLADKFGVDRLSSRHEWLNNILHAWLEQRNYDGRVKVMSEAVDHIIIDYFVDIARLKDFSEIEKTNDVKIYAYLAYWMLRRKPLQVVTEGNAEDLVFVNEQMTADFIIGFLYNDPSEISIVASQRERVRLFEDTLVYYFKYRTITAQVIEMILLSFLAGRGYQYSVDYHD